MCLSYFIFGIVTDFLSNNYTRNMLLKYMFSSKATQHKFIISTEYTYIVVIDFG